MEARAALALILSFVCAATAPAQVRGVNEIVDARATQLVARTEGGPRAVLELAPRADRPKDARCWVECGGERIDVELGAREPGVKIYIPVPLPEPGAKGTAAIVAESGGTSARRAIEYAAPSDDWVVHWIPGFHFDPVWWNTQANYISRGERVDSHMGAGHRLMEEYLTRVAANPGEAVALHQLPYVKTYIERFPERAEELRRLVASGRVDLVGGTYNEYSSTLVSAEAGLRNAVYGSLFQREVLGGRGTTFWQCDVFGHDPSFPSVMRLTGHRDGVFARGPFHQWGAPRAEVNFPSEFLWMAPDGKAVLTHNMTAHYGFGYERLASGANRAEGVGSRTNSILADIFEDLRRPALTHQVLVPMHMDFVRPLENLGEVLAAWNAAYVSPRMEVSTPARFFDGVRREIEVQGIVPRVITRDMNPIYTGCQVSFVDLKLANRRCESLLRDAEAWATIATLEGARYPSLGLDRAWRQLLFAAHHDGVTGSCGDQVYLDLLAGYDDAFRIAAEIRRRALDYLTTAIGSPDRVQWNSLSHARPSTAGGEDLIPPFGYRVIEAAPNPAPPTRRGVALENEHFRLEVDPARGGCLSRLVDKRTGRELLTGLGNELVLLDEYDVLPGHGEGPWHLAPSGGRRGGSGVRARLVEDESGGADPHSLVLESDHGWFAARQVITLPPGSRRIDFETWVVNWRGRRQLLRVEFPVDTPGARPVFETASAAVGRPFARDVDTAVDPWTLDNWAHRWAALGSLCEAEVVEGGTPVHRVVLGVGEIVVARGAPREVWSTANEIAAAFVRRGVTTTITADDERRYGDLTFDSNVPDFQVVVEAGEAGAGWRLEDRLGEPPRLTIRAAAWPSVAGEVERSGRIRIDAAHAMIDRCELPDRRGAALVHAGTGSLHLTPGRIGMNLLRANLSWPSGAWIDGEPRRHPDGSPFGAQHGTHVFRYALVPFEGDVPHVDLTKAAAELVSPVLETRESGAAAFRGGRPRNEFSYLSAEPSAVEITAVKCAGFPEARWQRRDAGEEPRAIVVRLWNSTPEPVAALLRVARPVVRAWACDALEAEGRELECTDGAVRVPLGPFEVLSVKIEVEPAPRSLTAPSLDPTDADRSESAYWLENRGEGATGNGMVGVWVEGAVPVNPSTTRATVRVANHCRNALLRVELLAESAEIERGALRASFDRTRLEVPPGATVSASLTLERSGRGAHEAPVAVVALLDDGRSVRDWLTPPEWNVASAESFTTVKGHVLAGAPRVGGSLLYEWDRLEAPLVVPRVERQFGGPESKRATHWEIERVPHGLRVVYGAAELVPCPGADGSPSLSIGVDTIRLKPGRPTRVLLRLQYPAGYPGRRVAPDLHAVEWVLPNAEWQAVPAGPLPAGTGNARDAEWDLTPGAEPSQGDLIVLGPEGSRAAARFVVCPEQRAGFSASSVKIDGELTEWLEEEFTRARGPLGAVQMAVRWGPEGLVFGIDVGDSVHHQPESGAAIWRGDSIQIALSPAPGTGAGYGARDLEFGVALTDGGPVVWSWYGGVGGKTGRVEAAIAAVTRRSAHTLYEVFLPKEVLPGIELRPNGVLGFTYIANDNDGTGYRGATEWTGGMTGVKDSSAFGELILLPVR